MPDSMAVLSNAADHFLRLLRGCVEIRNGRPFGFPRIGSSDARPISESMVRFVSVAHGLPWLWTEIERRGKFAVHGDQFEFRDANNKKAKITAWTTKSVLDRPADLLEDDCCGCVILEWAHGLSINELTEVLKRKSCPIDLPSSDMCINASTESLKSNFSGRSILNPIYVAVESLTSWAIQNAPDKHANLQKSGKNEAEESAVQPSENITTEPLNDTLLGILRALDGKALRVEEIAKIVTGGETTRLYRDGMKTVLESQGRIKLDRRIGYYRPDKPPLDRIPPCPKLHAKN